MHATLYFVVEVKPPGRARCVDTRRGIEKWSTTPSYDTWSPYRRDEYHRGSYSYNRLSLPQLGTPIDRISLRVDWITEIRIV